MHKFNECKNPDRCDIHIGNVFSDAFGGGSIIEQIRLPKKVFRRLGSN